MLPDHLETGDVSLRPPSMADAEDVFAYASDPEWGRFLPVPNPYLREDALAYLEKVTGLDRDQHPAWAVCVDDAVVGGVNIRFVAGHRIAEVGYGIARWYWGRGLTHQVMRAVIDAAFEAYPQLRRVRARADSRNVGSRRVMEKLGMAFEGEMRLDRFIGGELRNEVIYGVLREEWSA